MRPNGTLRTTMGRRPSLINNAHLAIRLRWMIYAARVWVSFVNADVCVSTEIKAITQPVQKEFFQFAYECVSRCCVAVIKHGAADNDFSIRIRTQRLDWWRWTFMARVKMAHLILLRFQINGANSHSAWNCRSGVHMSLIGHHNLLWKSRLKTIRADGIVFHPIYAPILSLSLMHPFRVILQ